MELKFGDPKSIAIKKDYESGQLIKRLKDKIKCPFCGAKAIQAFDVDIAARCIGWNFDCLQECPNSMEYSEKYGDDEGKFWTDFNGRFLEDQAEEIIN